jgi:Txe/YoeB family toxin of Txe-Axe toxin-antitoxin module
MVLEDWYNLFYQIQVRKRLKKHHGTNSVLEKKIKRLITQLTSTTYVQNNRSLSQSNL